MTEALLIDTLFAKSLLEKHSPHSKETQPFIEYLLLQARKGHLFCDIAQTPFAPIAPSLAPLCTQDQSPLVCHGTHYYLRRNLEIETQIITHLQRLSQAERPPLGVPLCPNLTPEQQCVAQLIDTHPLTIVTGGPGCGKTYTAKQCLYHLLQRHPHFQIIATAPTGKAVQCLQSQLPGIKTGTLHALLQLKEGQSIAQEARPLCADLILIDECSMIDAPLMAQLLSAIPTGTTVVFMGDPYQIPPVDIGAIFQDLTTIEELPHVHLTTSHRVKNSALAQLAQSIKQRNFTKILSLLQDPNYPTVTLQPLDQFHTADPPQQFLTPFHKGPYGTLAINALLRETHPKGAPLPIMITKNDASLELANGSMGILEGEEAHFPLPDGERRTLSQALLPPYTYAWCLSIHKSQGSEFANVGVLLPPQSETFGNELLYTAVTRAKEHLTLFTTEDTLQRCVETKECRRSNLCNRYRHV